MVPAMGKSGGKIGERKADEPRRALRARSVSEMLPAVGGAAFRRFGFVQSSVVSRWHEIVGERYARISAPESIRFPPGKKSDGVLTLLVDGAHGTMLQHVTPDIIERVNRFFGYAAVAQVHVRRSAAGVGGIRRPAPKLAEPVPIPAEMGDSLREISDPELRACLEALAQGVVASEAPVKEVAAIRVVGKLKG
jgi:hypothetical protein